MAQFQYQYADFTDEELTVENLNAWGEIGWQLVSNQVLFKDGHDVNHLIFKFEIATETTANKKFQYHITDLVEADMSIDNLNAWGANGWELVSNEIIFVKGDDEDGDINHAIFMAEITEAVVENG